MTSPEERQKVITTAQGLKGALEDVGKRLASLDSYGRRNRLLIRITGVFMALILGAGLVANNLQERYACGLANQQRAKEISLWETVITLSQPPAHATAEQRRQYYRNISKFHSYLLKTFTPRDCSAIYRY